MSQANHSYVKKNVNKTMALLHEMWYEYDARSKDMNLPVGARVASEHMANSYLEQATTLGVLFKTFEVADKTINK